MAFGQVFADPSIRHGITLVSALYGLLILAAPFITSLFAREAPLDPSKASDLLLTVVGPKGTPLGLKDGDTLTLRSKSVIEGDPPVIPYTPSWAYLLNVFLTLFGIFGQLNTAYFALNRADLNTYLPGLLANTLPLGLTIIAYAIFLGHAYLTTVHTFAKQLYQWREPEEAEGTVASLSRPPRISGAPTIPVRWSVM